MEIYINSIGHQNLQDIVTRKYNEFLYILAEFENIYYYLDCELRADAELHYKFIDLQNKMNRLALKLKEHKEFLADAGDEYITAEKLVTKSIDELPSLQFFSNRKTASAAQIITPLIQTGIIQYDLKTFPGVASLESDFSYVPAEALSSIKYDVKEMSDVVYCINFKTVDWDEICVQRNYSTYFEAVTLSYLNQNEMPKTREEYMRAVFDGMKAGYPEDLRSAFTESVVMTDYGWYRSTREDAVNMACEGYPSVVCGSNGFIGVITNEVENSTSVTAYCENGMISVETEQDIHFYIHR